MNIMLHLFYSLGISLEATRLMYSSRSSILLMLGRRHHEGMFESFWKLLSLHLKICFYLVPKLQACSWPLSFAVLGPTAGERASRLVSH